MFLIFLSDVGKFGLTMAVFAVIALAVVLGTTIPYSLRKKFAKEHSVALKKIDKINQSYAFMAVEHLEYCHDYDSDVNFANVSPKDYLIYQLVYDRAEAKEAIKNANKNAVLYVNYLADIKAIGNLGKYDVDPRKLSGKWLNSIEKKLFEAEIEDPDTTAEAFVRLRYVNMGGYLCGKKTETFTTKEIEEILKRLANKQGYYYADEGVWNAIVRVERAKVSNHMRFAIYKRDHERCRCCGSRHNLEIDHIVPIAKGGKTEWNNLQTLCHRCNVRKGTETKRY